MIAIAVFRGLIQGRTIRPLKFGIIQTEGEHSKGVWSNMRANDLGYLLGRTQRALRYAIESALADLKFSMAEYTLLSNVERYPSISNGELARLSFVTSQTIARTIDQLAARGLLVRCTSTTTGGHSEVHLTEEGKRLLEVAESRAEEVATKAWRALKEHELEELDLRLTSIAARLERSLRDNALRERTAPGA